MIDKSEITVYATIANLYLDVRTRAGLEWLCTPPKDSPLYQAVETMSLRSKPQEDFPYSSPKVASSIAQIRLWLYAMEYFIKNWTSNFKITGVSEATSGISERLGNLLLSCFIICVYLSEIDCVHPMHIFVPIAEDIYKLHFFTTNGKEGLRTKFTIYARKLVAGEDVMRHCKLDCVKRKSDQESNRLTN
jgi:hypothetical protein